ncbi:hypothetical protein DFJ74DRAFT_706892 [Hyaloraphidium curvatum]|nr:hypothetical protein DFJ74DRAFT_706892 [Hyaloraphidium curvatum]
MVNASTGKPRICLVTGSGSAVGIGFAMCRVFAREGGKVIISDIHAKEQDGLKLVAQLEAEHGKGVAMWVPLDVTDEASWEAAIAKIEAEMGVLDVACLNAGIAGPHDVPNPTLDNLDIATYRKIMEVNEMGVVLGFKHVAKSMKKNTVEEWKAIVTTSSVAGMVGGAGSVTMGYFGSKWAVRGITKAAAALGAPLKIRVNSIHPGLIATNMTQTLGWVETGGAVQTVGAGDSMVQRGALKRAAMPEEVANVALLLAGSEGSYLSGQGYVIDDGSLFNA